MNTELAQAYQAALIWACLDDFTASSALANLYGGQDGPNKSAWKQATIDFIYRNLVSKLIEINPRQGAYRAIDPQELVGMLESEDPDADAEIQPSIVWIALYFDGTALLESIVRKHGMLDWQFLGAPINGTFLADVCEMYRQHGVEIEGAPGSVK